MPDNLREDQILQRAYDENTNSLRGQAATGDGADGVSAKSENLRADQILMKVFDAATNALNISGISGGGGGGGGVTASQLAAVRHALEDLIEAITGSGTTALPTESRYLTSDSRVNDLNNMAKDIKDFQEAIGRIIAGEEVADRTLAQYKSLITTLHDGFPGLRGRLTALENAQGGTATTAALTALSNELKGLITANTNRIPSDSYIGSTLVTPAINVHNRSNSAHSNVIGTASEDGDGTGTLYARIKSLRDLISNIPTGGGGSGGATQEQIDEINHLIESVESKLSKDTERLKKLETTEQVTEQSKNFADVVESFPSATPAEIQRLGGLIDIALTQKGTAQNELVPTSDTPVNFGDTLSGINASTGEVINQKLPAAGAKVRFFYSNHHFSLGVPSRSLNPNANYRVRAFAAYTLGFASMGGWKPVENNPDRGIVGVNLGNFNQIEDRANNNPKVNRSETWGPAANRNPYDLRIIDEGVEREGAIIFLLPESQPSSNPSRRDPGYVGVFIQDSTHENILLKYGTGEQDISLLQRTTDLDVTFFKIASDGSLVRTHPALYLAPVGDANMVTLFGGNSVDSIPSSRKENSGFILPIAISLATRENNLNISQFRRESASVTPVTSKRMSIPQLTALILSTVGIPLEIQPLITALTGAGLGASKPVTRRKKYVQIYGATGTAFDLSSALTLSTLTASSWHANSFVARNSSFWMMATTLTLYMTTSNAIQSAPDQGGGGTTFTQVDISKIPKELNLPGYPTSGSVKRYNISSVFCDAGFNTTEVAVQFSIVPNTNNISISFKVDRVKGAGSYLRYLQQIFALEERYIDSEISFYARDTGYTSSISPMLTGFEMLEILFPDPDDLFGVELRLTSGTESLVAYDGSLITPYSSDRRNPFYLPLGIDATGESPAQTISVGGGGYGDAFGNSRTIAGRSIVAWIINRKCTVDIYLNRRAAFSGTFRLRKININKDTRVTIPSDIATGDVVASIAASPTQVYLRATFEPGDIIFLTHSSRTPASINGLDIRLSAFAL